MLDTLGAHGEAGVTASSRPAGESDLDADDFRRLGALHVECIDDSLPALLGPRFAARLYAFLDRSESEYVLCERVDGRVESAVVVSESPGDLQRRIARATLPQLLVAAGIALFTRWAFGRLLLGTLGESLRHESEPVKAPEITYIFTNSRLQGQQLGKRLIQRVDEMLRTRGVDVYYVKTLDDPANRAIAFYEREGFERIGRCEEAGRSFVVFHKRLGER